MRTAWWRALALVLLLVGVICLVQWGQHSSDSPAVATPSGVTSSTSGLDASSGLSSTPKRHEVPPARPVAVRIPAIGVDSTLTALGLNTDGTVEVPSDPALAGWYRPGTRPGARGSAVILGHVDSVDGPAVFYRLRTLGVGALVEVRLADGTSAAFRVVSVRLYPNDEFPARAVYADPRGRTLNLVTCGGDYDSARGGYQANVVVHARLVRGPATA